MKLRNMVKKFSCGLLATTMVLSLVACGSKESDDDDEKEEKKSKATVEKSVDDLMSDITANAYEISTEDIEKALEDDCLTYEEFEGLLKKLPSCKAEANFDFDISAETEYDGDKESEEIVVDCSYLVEYDSENMGIHYNIEMKMETYDEKENMSMDLWIVNEDGTYYSYELTSDDDVAYRTELGNIKELFGENGISKDALLAAIEEIEIPEEYMDLYNSIEDFSESKMAEEFKEYFSLAKEYVEYSGKEYYNLVMNFDAADMLNTIKDSDEVKELLEALEIAEIDELLEMEITEGLTVQDFIDITKFDINYYIDPTELFVTHIECDFKDFLDNTFGVIEKFYETYAESMDEDISIDITCNSASISYDFDNDADVTVKFDGEYEDISINEDYDDDDFYGSVTINGNTFELCNYDDEVISNITIPDGLTVNPEYSSNTYVLLEGDDLESVYVYNYTNYWVEDLMEGLEYEADLEFYTRDEASEVDSVVTNQGTVRVFVNTWSCDDNPAEDYFQTIIYLLETKDGDIVSIEGYIDEIEGLGYTTESFIQTMLK